MTAWKPEPGDVALVRCSDGEWRRAWCISSLYVDGGHVLVFEDGGRRDSDASPSRPLVVIDPENREQVKRLDLLLQSAFDDGSLPRYMGTVDLMQTALRSLIAPPKPDEPLGLGAVVEDADGDRWVRWQSGPRFWVLNPGGNAVRYADIAAVKVLSEGVTV